MKISILLLSLTIFQSTSSNPVHKKIQSNLGKNARIIGGTDATAGQFPFMVAITVIKPDGRYFCAGTLWLNQWVLTAGQCTNDATSFTLNFGSHYLTTDDPNRKTTSTSTSYVHPDFQPLTLQNDIGLIKLRLPMELTDYIRPIDGLPYSDLGLNQAMYIDAMGWGQTSDSNSQLSEVLQHMEVATITNRECTAVYSDQVITDNMICIAGNDDEGTCTGDTGSPIILITFLKLFFQYGIASFHSAQGCETPDPSGYSRTYPYKQWVNETTGYVN